MFRIRNKPWTLAAALMIIIITLLLLVEQGRCESSLNKMPPLPIISEQYGALTYVIAVQKECNGVPINPGRWMGRLFSECDTKYHHLIIHEGGSKPILVGITTDSIPTEQLMRTMLRRYLMMIISGGM